MVTIHVMELLANTVVSIMLQFTNVSSKPTVHLKLHNGVCPFYLNKDGKTCFLPKVPSCILSKMYPIISKTALPPLKIY